MKQIITLTALFSMAFTLVANDWPNWRGPNFNGSTDAVGLPAKFSKTENIAWSTAMPGPSAATPIIWKDKIFVSSSDPKAKELLAMCLSRTT